MGRGRFRAICAVLTALAVGLALSACGGSSSGEPTSQPNYTVPTSTPGAGTSAPPTTSSPSGPVTPTSPTLPSGVPSTGPNTQGDDPPIMPVVATQHTAAGAKAFAAFFIRTIDWAYATTSTTYMKLYYRTGCVECAGFATAIEDVAKKHQRYIGNRLTITTVQAQSQGRFLVDFAVTSGEIVGRDGKFVDGAPPVPHFREIISTSWTSGSWRIVNMEPRNG